MRGQAMVYCNCKKTNHNKGLACAYYIHYLENSKKNLQIPEKVRSVVHGSSIPCSQSFFHLPHQGLPIFFGHLKSSSGSLSGKKYYRFMASPKIPLYRFRGNWKFLMSELTYSSDTWLIKFRSLIFVISTICSQRCFTAGKKRSLKTVLQPLIKPERGPRTRKRSGSRIWRKSSKPRMKCFRN